MRLPHVSRKVLLLALVLAMLTSLDPSAPQRVHAAGDAASSMRQRAPDRSPKDQPIKSPKLESQLASVSAMARSKGSSAARSLAPNAGVAVESQKVRVVIQQKSTSEQQAKQLVARIGGTVEGHYKTLTEALVPMDALRQLETDPSVTWVRRPRKPKLLSVTGEGVRASGANRWHAAGDKGAGVKIAIIDAGFQGYRDSIDAGELKNVAGAEEFGCGAVENGEDHGTNVAEIVSEIAPEATLYLLCIGGDPIIGTGLAKDRAIELGVDIIQESLGWNWDGRGDGSGGPGTTEAITKDAREHGILWVAAAGNEAESHWHGKFKDEDNDFSHEFAPGDEFNEVYPEFLVEPGTFLWLDLAWDEWPASSQDYDLYVWELDAVTGAPIAIEGSAVGTQDGTQPPAETLFYFNGTGRTIRLGIEIYDYNKSQGLATTTPRLDLFIDPGYALEQNMEYLTASGSLLYPGGVSDVVGVGAVCWSNDKLESYSSQGPMPDGRLKPDIAGQTNVSTSLRSYVECPKDVAFGTDGFNGTSAASPHVAGAAALLKSANRSATPARLRTLLEARTRDLGPRGKDPMFGAGILSLGDPDTPDETIADNGSSNGSQQTSNDDSDGDSRKDKEKVKAARETDEQRQQDDRTNQSNKDDYFAEGNVLEVRPETTPPSVVIGNRDGNMVVQLECRDQCPKIRVGDYIEVDGVKEHEGLFEAEAVQVTRIR